MRAIYNLGIHIFGLLISFASLFNSKASLWVEGRRNLFGQMKKEIKPDDRIVWFHCASLGEFEQGRPVIEVVRKNYPDFKILLTFFSPSGYEKRKNYPFADYVFYLPLDTRHNASKFLKIVNPEMVFFIKYEFWYNYIEFLFRKNVPTYYISSIFRPSQYFFKPWGSWMRKQLQKITFFFVQDEASLLLLESIHIFHAEVSGDTRFDRVNELKEEKVSYPAIENYQELAPLLIAGSTWPADEELLFNLLSSVRPNFNMLIAPHEVDKERISKLMLQFGKFNPVLFSELDSVVENNSRVIVVNSIGQLSYLYRYAKLAYIGGGFGTGIHNILEAATYGVPVLHGPNYQRFLEAVELLENRGSFVVHQDDDFREIVSLLLNDPKEYSRANQAARKYVADHVGATQRVIKKTKELF